MPGRPVLTWLRYWRSNSGAIWPLIRNVSFWRSSAVSTVLGVNWATLATKLTLAGMTNWGTASSTIRTSAPTATWPATLSGRKKVMYTSLRLTRFSTRPPAPRTSPGSATRYCTRPYTDRTKLAVVNIRLDALDGRSFCVHLGPRIKDFGGGRTDSSVGSCGLRLGRTDRCLRALKICASVIQSLDRDKVFRGQRLGSQEELLSGIKLCFSLRYNCDCGGLIGAPLRYLALSGRDADNRALKLGFRLPALCHKHVGVHLDQKLPGADEIAFVHRDGPDTFRNFGVNVDLGRFDAAVPACETFRQTFRFKKLPSQKSNGAGGDNEGGPYPPSAFL